MCASGAARPQNAIPKPEWRGCANRTRRADRSPSPYKLLFLNRYSCPRPQPGASQNILHILHFILLLFPASLSDLVVRFRHLHPDAARPAANAGIFRTTRWIIFPVELQVLLLKKSPRLAGVKCQICSTSQTAAEHQTICRVACPGDSQLSCAPFHFRFADINAHWSKPS